MTPVTASVPLALTPEMIAAVRDDPTTKVADQETWHARLGWLICAWDVLLMARPAAPAVPRWPLGVNPSLDEHAAKHGLSHWSATSAGGNDCWLRRDGLVHRCKWDKDGGYPAELHALDIEFRPSSWVF